MDLEQVVQRGSELLKQGSLDEAQQAFRTALATDAGNPRVLALLGLAYFRGGNFDAARPIYEQLVERLPTDASHRLNLGLVYLKVGDAENAIAALEASRALDPSQGRAVSYLGLAYARAGRYAEAYRAFMIAGQTELAKEIEINLTATELEAIHAQLQRAGHEPAKPPEPPKPEPPKPEPAVLKEEPPKGEGWFSPSLKPPAQPAPPPPPPEPVVEKLSEPEIRIEAPKMTDSVQFVMPPPEAVPAATQDGRSMISRAVEAASPTSASVAPQPLSQLAITNLVRPDDSDHPFEVSENGSLVIRVVDRVVSRLAGVHVTGGDLAYEPATRRSRGHQTEEPFTYGGTPLHIVTGRGYLIALPDDRLFTAVTLDDDIFYLREDLVFAFEPTLRWENGNVPGLRGRLPVVQFRGDGSVAILSKKPLVRVKLPQQGLLLVDANKLAGWIGRVIPRAVVPPEGGPMAGVCVECTGEGVVLVDPVGDPGPPPELAPVKDKLGPPPPPQPAPRDSVEDLTAELAAEVDDAHDEF